MQLGWTEIGILRALARDEFPCVSSAQRLRLELLGLAVDTANGLVLTEAGLRAARNATPTRQEEFDRRQRPTDALGRKRMLDRTLPGS
jgi:hypothetical protein